MADSTSDPWQLIFFGGAALLIVLQALRGWQLGVVRQTVQVFAIAGAYGGAWFGGPQLAPYLKPLGFPNFVLTGIAGACIALVIYTIVSIASAVLFKKTADQNVAIVRFGYGAAGAFVGMLFGVFLVLLVTVGIRFLGSLAEAEIEASRHRAAIAQANLSQPGVPIPETSGWMRSLAGMKHSIENGPAGSVVQQIDPLPGTLYVVMQKVGSMVSNPASLQRFMTYPGVKPITEHPKIQTLQNDPEIAKAAAAQDILTLLRNPNIVAAANDPEIVALITKLEFEKALDYALGKPEKPQSAPPVR